MAGPLKNPCGEPPPPQQNFEEEVKRLQKDAGREAVDSAYRVFAVAVRWLCREGHGSLELTAINHRFGQNLKAHTLLTVNRIY